MVGKRQTEYGDGKDIWGYKTGGWGEEGEIKRI